MATQLAMPLLSASQEFKDGSITVDPIAVMEELFGTAGYRDGGKRFIKQGKPSQNPLADLQAEELKSKIEKNKKSGSGSLLTGLAAVAKVALGSHELEAAESDAQMTDARATADSQQSALEADRAHQLKQHDQLMKAHDQGFQHGHAIVQHQHDAMKPEPQKTGPEGKPIGPAPAPPVQLAPPMPNPIQIPPHAQPPAPQMSGPAPGGGLPPMGGPPPGMPQQPLPQAMPATPQLSTPPAAGRQMIDAGLQRGQGGQISGASIGGGKQVVFIRDPDTNRIVGARIIESGPQQPSGPPQLPPMGLN
jgi:hypothetical protein